MNLDESHSLRLANAVKEAMTRQQSTLSAIESCTAGLVASTLTDVPGAGYFLGGAVAYDPEVKVKFGVPRDLIDGQGLVSAEVALSLAECSARWFGTDYGLGVTGVAGPGSEDGVPPGTAFAAVWSKRRGGTVLPMRVSGERPEAKAEMAYLAIGLLLEEIDRFRNRRTSPAVEAWIGR